MALPGAIYSCDYHEIRNFDRIEVHDGQMWLLKNQLHGKLPSWVGLEEHNAPVQRPKYVGVAFAKAKGMTTCFGHFGTSCYC